MTPYYADDSVTLYATFRPPVNFETGTTAQEATMSAWTDWLAAEGYGIDYSHDTDPPCSLRELAEAYHRTDPTVTVDDWEWCITENTGAFDGAA